MVDENFYESRKDKQINDWVTNEPHHVLQTDSNNCGIFVINYIKFYILKSEIAFDTIPTSLAIDRSNVAQAI